jgi:RNA polymerase sigma-70 factor (ECF subfamily)
MKRLSLKEKYLLYKVRENQDAQAYGKLYDIYVTRIYRFILFKVGRVEEAEDLTSEVFLKTWEYMNSTKKGIKNLNALLYRIARNCVIDHYRSKAHNATTTQEEIFEKIEDKRDLPEEANLKMEVESIERHLKQLKDVYREVIILKYIEEFSIGEIADILEKTKGNVRVLLHRAVGALKEIAGDR